MLGLAERGQVGVDDGGYRAAVTEVDLELAEIFALLQQVGGIAVPEGVNVGGFLDAAGTQSQAEATLERAAAHRLGGGGRALAAVTFGWEEEAGMAMALPACTEQQEGALREGDVTVTVALAATDVQEHALRVNVADLQVQALAQAQATGIDGDQGDAVVQRRHRGEDATDLRGGQDDGELELRGGPDELDLGGPGSVERLLPEVLDGTDGLGGTGAGEAAVGLEVEEVLPEVLGAEVFGGAPEVLAQLAHAGQVGLLGAGQEREETEVFGEAV